MRPTRDHDQNTYLHGTYNAICDVCGFKKKAVDMLKRWDGLFVCKDDFETRHLLDFGRAPRDSFNVPDPRPDPEPRFVDVPYIQELTPLFEPVWTTVYLNEVTAEYDGGPVYGVTVTTDTYSIHQNYGGGIWDVLAVSGLPYRSRITATVLSATPDTEEMYLSIEEVPVPSTHIVTLASNNVVVEIPANTRFNAVFLPVFAPGPGPAVTVQASKQPSMVMGLIPSMEAVFGAGDSIVAQLKIETTTSP